MYQVGDLLDVTNEDIAFEVFENAQCKAIEASLNQSFGQPVGVWTGEDEGTILLSIAFEGKIFNES